MMALFAFKAAAVMTSYASLSEMRGATGRLDQLTDTNANRDTLLQACLDQATSIINMELGFALTAAAPGTQTVYGTATVWLPLPLFTAGSVSLVATLSGYTVPSYVESGGALRITNSTGIYTAPPDYRLTPASGYGYGYGYDSGLTYGGGGVWLAGVPYTVSATYGASADDLNAAKMCCLEIAVMLWKFRDSGGSTAVGTENAVVVVKNAYSPVVSRMLGYLRREQASHYAMVY